MNDTSILLNYLRAITASGSISAAARQLYISQPYLSRYIHEKEAELGITLLNRKTHPISLTDGGAKYLQGIENLDNQYKSLVSEVNEMTYNQKANIRIGINQSISSQLLPKLIAHYTTEFPGRKVFVKEGPSSQMEDQLLNHQIDVHVRMLPIFPNEIMYQELCDSPVYLIINRSCPLYRRANDQVITADFPLKEIGGSDMIFLHSGSGFMRLIELFLANNKLSLNQKYEVKYLEMAANMAYEGLGCTFVPGMFLHETFNPNKCNVLKIPTDKIPLKLVVSYLKDSALNEVVQEFVKVATNTAIFTG